MLTVTFADLTVIAAGLLLPMRLIQYNGGNRKLVITANTMDLPQPVVIWLQASPQYRSLIGDVRPVAVLHAAAQAGGETISPESEVYQL